MEVAKLKLAKANHDSQKYRLEDNIIKHYPMQMSALRERIAGYGKDIAIFEANKPQDKDHFEMEIAGKLYTDKKEAGAAVIAFCREIKTGNMESSMGEYLGMKLSVRFDTFSERFKLNIRGNMTYSIEVGNDPLGNITRINNALEGIAGDLDTAEKQLKNIELQLETAKAEVLKPFDKESELNAKLVRLAELNAELNMDERGDNAADMEDEAEKREEMSPEKQEEEAEPEAMEKKPKELKVSEASLVYHTGRSTERTGDRPSLLEKMERYKVKLSDADIQKSEQKETVLQERRSYGAK